MKRFAKTKGLLYGLGLAMLAGGPTLAHELGDPGGPVCLEGNYMLADAQYAPFAAAGPGRVLEMNITTGERGITVNNPFNPANVGTPICPDTVTCATGATWKPTGVASGGVNGHPFIVGEAQGTLTEFHRDGTPIRTIKFPTRPVGDAFGNVPRPLGAQFLPNGNFVQTVCDTNFNDAPNSDPILDSSGVPIPGSNSSSLYFPPTYDTDARASNSRLLVIDQETLEVIDEYSRPAPGELGHDLWNCMADVAVTGEGMFMSLFHGAAVLVIDWKAGVDNEKSEGIGANRKDKDDDDADDAVEAFELGKPKNRAKVIRVIDLLEDGDPSTPPIAANDPMRRDALRAITFDESGALYAAFRKRSRPCLRGEIPGTPGGCNPGVFRQHVAVVPPGMNYPTRTIGLDPGVNVVAGIRTNRISGVACANINPGHTDPDACDVETLLISASAFNPGCAITTGPAPNPCFVPGGGVGEYLIDPAHADNPATCTGDPLGVNTGCAQPVATFKIRNPQITGPADKLDPRMLMTIHEAFIQ
jgi:hypothetical protein